MRFKPLTALSQQAFRRARNRSEEAVLGEGAVAAPIFDRRSQTVGAIGVVGPRERVLRRGRDRTLGTAVIEAARGISRDLGATRWPAI